MKRLPALALLALSLSTCGGSASETPWPAEPDDVDLGPIGESQREESVIKAKGSADAADAPSAVPSDDALPAAAPRQERKHSRERPMSPPTPLY